MTRGANGSRVPYDELVEHLKYGSILDPSKPAPVVAPPVVAPSVAGSGGVAPSRNKRQRDVDDSEDGGGKLARARGSSPVSRKSPALLPPSVLNIKNKPDTKKVPSVKDEEEALMQLYQSMVKAGKFPLFKKTMKNATIDAKFQNEAGSCPGCFSPSDSIYVSLTFHNPTDSDVYVKLGRRNFPRGGIRVIIHKGEKFPMKIANRVPMVAKKLSPGESHTFTPRKLCAGRKVESETDLGRLESEFVPYWTPAKAGTYRVEFPLWDKEFSFVVREDGDEDGGACSKE